MAIDADAAKVTAVLGPTNTGKTHLAIERMLGHSSGMIGFPLRLLARENYDKIVKLKGRNAVALVTGEERIIPPHPRWYVCTVEAMPLDRQVEFLAVDEIQLMGDPERGHVFTERLLHARGRSETMFMGSDTVRQILKQLVPQAEIIARPRFSTLSYTGPKKITRLPPRSAIVAFSVADVFEIAELVRRQRGGTAIVMGALSPRARNAQVALYQNGDVDYMVATDAIGMGLNMSLDHVALARLSKFDGQGPRRLTAAEIAQIAGRAGRHMNDGSFGTAAEAGPLDPETVEAIENHRFDPLTSVWWRNDSLDFRSIPGLLRSLEQRPPLNMLTRVGHADDQTALAVLARNTEITAAASSRARIRLLWDVCQVPDFRKVMSEHHSHLLSQIFLYLCSGLERLPPDWIEKQIGGLDRMDGEIDTLVQRIAHIRTWTYITHRANWLNDAKHWQERAIGIEDRLSDALHDRITQRFVDRRAAFLVKHLDAARELMASVSAEGEVMVEGHYVGQMVGMSFVPDPSAIGDTARTLLIAANRILPQEVAARSRLLAAASDEVFALTPDGTIMWQEAIVGKLVPGDAPLRPKIDLHPADFLDGTNRDAVRRRLSAFVRTLIEQTIPVITNPHLDGTAASRGLLFRLQETLGVLDAEQARPLIVALTVPDRKALARLGIRLGTKSIYVDKLLKPTASALRSLLWALFSNRPLPVDMPPPGQLSVEADLLRGDGVAEAAGYRIVGRHAVRADRLEKFAAALRQKMHDGPFVADKSLASLVGVAGIELPPLITAMGYRHKESNGVGAFVGNARKPRPRSSSYSAGAPPDNPFAILRALSVRR